MSRTTTINEFTIMTFNIRFKNNKDALNKWDNRRKIVKKVIKNYNPDIFGLQEVVNKQIKDIKEDFPEYSYYSVWRDGYGFLKRGEAVPIFYKKSWKVLEKDTFWLSENPNRPSKSWSRLKRICSWLFLVDSKSENRKIIVLNTHFPLNKEGREKSIKLIFSKIEEIKNQLSEKYKEFLSEFNETDSIPLILMGDLNLDPKENTYKLLKSKMQDALAICKPELINDGVTFHHWSGIKQKKGVDKKIINKLGLNIIDFIFYTGSIKPICERTKIITDNSNNILKLQDQDNLIDDIHEYRIENKIEINIEEIKQKYIQPSDHFPVLSSFKFLSNL